MFRTDHRGASFRLNAQQLQAMAGPLAGVLYEVGLVENDPGPVDGMETIRVFAEEIVVDDDPTRSIGLILIDAQNLDGSLSIDHEYLGLPVQFYGSGTYNEDRPFRTPGLHCDDCLAGFAKPHVVGQDCAFLGQ